MANDSMLFAYSSTDNITYQLNRFAALKDREDAKVVSKGNADESDEPFQLDAFRFAGRFLGKAILDE
eukprot:5117102-Prorocentrum_lima.AAC.1